MAEVDYSSGRWNVRALREKGYKDGAVLRVKMVNFLTYDKCEVFPGPRLNVVLGPNGTGKSSITHAICLACAGKPENVGRSPELKQFVKRGKEDQESYVEIDILWEGITVHTIRRTLSSTSDTSIWHHSVNNAQKNVSTLKKIKELMTTMRIDVGNLCSFMPQDKVGNFSRYTQKEILSETLKCIRSSNADNGDDDSEESLYTQQIGINTFYEYHCMYL